MSDRDENRDEIGKFVANYVKRSIEEETYNLFSKLSGGSGTSAAEPATFSYQNLLDIIEKVKALPPAIEIYEDRYCYKTEIRARGRADRRRPNSKKPLYRRVVKHKPLMFKFENKIIAHPLLAIDLRVKLAQGSSDDHIAIGFFGTKLRFR